MKPGRLSRLAALASILSLDADRGTRMGNPRRRNWLKGTSKRRGPFNRDQERARRRRQIESGALKLGPEGGLWDWESES